MADSTFGSSHNSSTSQIATLRVAGAWSGQVEVYLDDWSVAQLRSHLAQLSGFPVDSVNLICAGRNLKDDVGTQRSLRQVGVRCNSKLLMTRVGSQQASLVIEEQQRIQRLDRIKAAADSMAKRSDADSYPTDDFDIQLENQSGEKIRFHSDSDRRALITGLMLHAKARNLLQECQYAEALEVLAMAEEAFLLCNPEILGIVDNVALLQIDTVWCYFMLKDITRLAVAGERLSKAREGLRCSHGTHLERLRVLQGGFCPELAIYVRLELLEGVVAFHSGHFEAAHTSLISAQSKYQQLQVSDDSLAFLVGMGFKTKESRRALRVSVQDVNKAVEFLMGEKRKKSEKRKDDIHHQKRRREQKQYGMTNSGMAVDITKVDELASIGYDRILAAEALQRTENDWEATLDILTDPVRNAAVQCELLSTSSRPQPEIDEADSAELIDMGFQRERVIHALQQTQDKAKALDQLLEEALSTVDSQAFPGSTSAAREDNKELQESTDTALKPGNVLDEEMEREIAKNITGDPLAEYDIEVEKEGEAIAQYLVLLDSTVNTS